MYIKKQMQFLHLILFVIILQKGNPAKHSRIGYRDTHMYQCIIINIKYYHVLYYKSRLPRWNKCVSRASSEYTGFGMAAGHKYILEYFDEDAKDTVNKTEYVQTSKFILKGNQSQKPAR